MLPNPFGKMAGHTSVEHARFSSPNIDVKCLFHRSGFSHAKPVVATVSPRRKAVIPSAGEESLFVGRVGPKFAMKGEEGLLTPLRSVRNDGWARARAVMSELKLRPPWRER